ncbi:MAG: ABC transporter permease [Planctomycetota bacterium]|nr:ABC transporter permease [Planctomycetota bacterium]
MKSKLTIAWIGLWLGWQVESNWTHPLFYAFLSAIRPISASLILIFMYYVVIGGDFSRPEFAHLYIGHTFFLFIGSLLMGISFTIHDDRDHYQMFRYLYLAPGGLYAYLIGRGGTRLLTTTFAVAVNLAVGIWFFRIPIGFETIHPVYFIISLVTGLVAIMALGILLAGFHIITSRHSFFLGEGLAGVFYLLCGCIYTLDVLPPWAQTVGKWMPFTYWFSALRRSLGLTELSQGLAGISLGGVVGLLVAFTLLLAVIAHYFYKAMERVALRHGKIDVVFNY